MDPSSGSSSGQSSSASFRESLREAIRFWERRRVWYNLALAGLCLAWVIRTWPAFRPAVVVPHLPELLVLIGLANLCYCAAYLVEISVNAPTARETWRQWRWVLWLAGTLFALLVAQYWIGDEIYPSVR
jgi:hypothetical protein